MRKLFLLLFPFSFFAAQAQFNLDTLAIQDFEVVPATPTWTFTGPVIYNSGYSSPTAAPPNSPIGIGGSRAWETTTNSGGLVLEFANVNIPTIYDSIRVHFRLAAMNLSGSTGGPDDLDYVLVQYSTDGGTTYFNRMRIRGALNNNSFWEYAATGYAKLYYQPATEVVFQPINTGLATTLGYSNCEIVFPGSVTQVRIKITGRSSSSTDTWLVDNVLIMGENSCSSTTATINPVACDSYTAPSGAVHTASGTYQDIIPNSLGCDSIITINLGILNSTSATLNPSVCNNYTAPSGAVYTSGGTYLDTIPNSAGCDSILTINLTVTGNPVLTLNETACDSYTSAGGNTYSASGTYNETWAAPSGCDTLVTLNLTVNQSTSETLNEVACGSFTLNSQTYTSSGTYVQTLLNAAGCDSTLTLLLTIQTVNTGIANTGTTLTSASASGTYQWLDCGNGFSPVAGATSQSFTPAVSGSYAVMVNVSGCVDTSACESVTVAGVESALFHEVLVYPNPGTGTFSLSGLPNGTRIEIYSLKGELLSAFKASGEFTFNLDQAAPGRYLLKLNQGENIAARWLELVE